MRHRAVGAAGGGLPHQAAALTAWTSRSLSPKSQTSNLLFNTHKTEMWPQHLQHGQGLSPV